MGFEIALTVVGVLIAIVGMVSGIISLWLIAKYYKYNRRSNSIGMTGMEIARSILDRNGLEHIGVKRTGSLWFGNSYSHYFKKVRLRSFIRHNYTPYDGDESFLAGPTEATNKLWDAVQKLQKIK